MKKLFILVGLILVCASVSSANIAGHGGVSLSVFYSSLGPYGEWIPVGGDLYGWRPVGVAAGWHPYMYGRWAWTDDGWFWVSDEPWGWAVFHYGRWYFDDYYGWVWIPGYDWAPAWVEWRYGGPYVGWAPLSPYAVFEVGFGVRYTSRWVTPVSYWTFVDCRYVSSPSLHRYVYRPEYNSRYFGRTRGAGNVHFEGGRIMSRGPARQYIEQRGNIRIDRAVIADAPERGPTKVLRQGAQDRIEVYRPTIEAQASQDIIARPERVREDNRKVSLDVQHIDAGPRGLARETNKEVSPRGQAVAPRGNQRGIERAPAPAQSRPAPKVEKQRERPKPPDQRKEEKGRNDGQIRKERSPRMESDRARNQEQRSESVDRPRVQRERPVQYAPVARRSEFRREAGPARASHGGGRSEPAPRERRER